MPSMPRPTQHQHRAIVSSSLFDSRLHFLRQQKPGFKEAWQALRWQLERDVYDRLDYRTVTHKGRTFREYRFPEDPVAGTPAIVLLLFLRGNDMLCLVDIDA